jgi:hypothetical protein
MKGDKIKLACLAATLIIVFSSVTVIAVNNEKIDDSDSPLYDIRAIQSADLGVEKEVITNYIGIEKSYRDFGFPESTFFVAKESAGDGIREATDMCTEWLTGGCFTCGGWTCWASAECRQTCPANPCGSTHQSSCEGTCEGPNCPGSKLNLYQYLLDRALDWVTTPIYFCL